MTSPPDTAASPRFDTPAGQFVGWRDGAVVRATGIRYGRAERFGRPAPEPPADEPVEALEWSPACPQNTLPELANLLGDTMTELPRDEDCLRLSVTAPGHDAEEPRPVMVWIHGGAYVLGSGDARIHDPALLVAEQDLVVVNLTFRLGLFGFLGGYSDRPANLGLLDILTALRWVRDNIAGFGGDPENVTLFGESAGGDAIAHLLATDDSRRLFGRAIIQSAPFGMRSGRAKMTAAMGEKAAGVDVDVELPSVLHWQNRVAAVGSRHGLVGGMPFGVQYGHDPLPPEDEVEKAWARRAREVEVLVGSTADEASLFVDALPTLAKLAGLPLVGRHLRRLATRLGTWLIFSRPGRKFARRYARAGGRAYHYELTWGAGRTRLGATHMSDVPLLLGLPEVWADLPFVGGIGAGEIAETGEKVREVWARFARTGRLEDSGSVEPGVLSWQRQ